MLFRAVVASLVAATLALGAALPETSESSFLPSGKPLPTPVYDDVPQPLTNAERLRRGMAPLPPVVKRFGMHAPGPVKPVPDMPGPSAAPPEPSGGGTIDTDPPIIHEGIIQVSDPSNGQIIGYVSQGLTQWGQLAVDRNYRTPTEVTFKTKRAGAKPGSIEITNGDDPSGNFFGAVASEWSQGSILGPGGNVFAYLTRTGETKQDVGPMSVPNGINSHTGKKLKAESALWTANQFTGEIYPAWTNPSSGAPLQTTIFFYKKYNSLAITADPDAFKAANSDATKVVLNIVAKPFY